MSQSMFTNLASGNTINEWINKSVTECQAVYPLIQQRLPVAVDIGANIGGFCVHAHQHFDRIYAFEPLAQNYRVLQHIVNQLGLRNVDAYQTAIYGKSNLELSLRAHDDGQSGDVSCAAINNQEWGFSPIEEKCETISLSDMMQSLNLPHIHYLKMDCEGSEYEILENFTEFDRISLIAMELHNFFGRERKDRLLQRLEEHFNVMPLRRDTPLTRPADVMKHIVPVADLLDGDCNFFCVNKQGIKG